MDKQVTEIMLLDVRLLYGAALFEPQRGPNGEGDLKYSATFGFAPTHPAHAAIKEGFRKAAEDKWGAKAAETYAALKAGDKLCLHDGASKPGKEGYANILFVSASNKLKPLVIDGNKSPLAASAGRPYSGCYVNARIQLWAQDNRFGKRINASLQGVQFLRDGERLSGGGVASADDFQAIPEAVGAGAPVTQAGATMAQPGVAVDPFA